MPKMICAVDRTIATTLGYVIEFKKGEPVHVPDRLVAQLMEAGVYPVDGEETKVAAITEEPLTAKQLEPHDAEERQRRIIAMIKSLFADNKLVFTAGGKPSPAPLSKALGFPIDAGERDIAWEACKGEIGLP